MATSAVMVDPSGRGEVLIVPYYTVNAGQQTQLTIVNESNTGKALKLRFREARNGRETLSLNLYMGEFDVWTATLSATERGEARLSTSDNSCTVPAIKTSTTLPQLPDGSRYAPFRTTDFSGANADGWPADVGRTREGYVEIIEMGALENNSDSDFAATHIGGVPRDCAALVDAWSPAGYWTANPAQDLLPPQALLSATARVVDGSRSVEYAMPVTALSKFSVVVQHTMPGAVLPDLGSAVTETARQQVESVVMSEGKLYRSYWPQARAIDAVTAALSVEQFSNEYDLGADIPASSEWILTFPTRRHYPVSTDASSMLPFYADRTSASKRPVTCSTTYPAALYDREARRPIGHVWPLPTDPPPYKFCTAVQSLSFQAATSMVEDSLLQSRVSQLVTTLVDNNVFRSGVARFFFYGFQKTRPALDGATYVGIPAIGFAVYRAANGAYGQAATQHHGGVTAHRTRVNCTGTQSPCAPL